MKCTRHVSIVMFLLLNVINCLGPLIPKFSEIDHDLLFVLIFLYLFNVGRSIITQQNIIPYKK